MTNKVIPREFAIIHGDRRPEIDLAGSDLVWVIAPNFEEINQSFCFFKNFILQGMENFVELELIDGTNVKVPQKVIGGLEVVARNGTRQCEVLVNLFIENDSLKKRVEYICKNFDNLLGRK